MIGIRNQQSCKQLIAVTSMGIKKMIELAESSGN
jgi:hypothetical protein